MKTFEQYHRDNPGVYERLAEIAKLCWWVRPSLISFDHAWARACWELKQARPALKPHRAYKASYMKLMAERNPGMEFMPTEQRATLEHDPSNNAMTLTVGPVKVKA